MGTTLNPNTAKPATTTNAAATRQRGNGFTGGNRLLYWRRRVLPTDRRNADSTPAFPVLKFAAPLPSECRGRTGRYIRYGAGQTAACGSTSRFPPACATGASTPGTDIAGPTPQRRERRSTIGTRT